MCARSYATGMQTIALFGLKLKRLTAVLGALAWFLMCVVVALAFLPVCSTHTHMHTLPRPCCNSSCALILPVRTGWIRSASAFPSRPSLPFSPLCFVLWRPD